MSETTMNEYGPEIYASVTPTASVTIGPRAAQARDASKTNWTVTKIDRLAGGRANRLRVNVANPKKPGSIAHRNWGLYGNDTSVDAFLRAFPAGDGGLGRARSSLTWDLNYGYVSVIGADGNVIDA